MKEKLQKRIASLQLEYQKGQEKLEGLEQETEMLKATMLRISGAIQVLQEMVDNETEETKVVKEEVQIKP